MSQEQLWDAGPVRIIARRGRPAAAPEPPKTCGEPDCTNPVRRRPGARYCDTHARSIGYELRTGSRSRAPWVDRECARCGSSFKIKQRLATPLTAAWSEFCPDCHRASPLSLDQLQTHHASPDLARSWLRLGDDLRCDICGRQLERRTSIGKAVIDHNHGCCAGERSCGACIRGVLCSRCNTMVGYVETMTTLELVPLVFAYLHYVPDLAQQSQKEGVF